EDDISVCNRVFPEKIGRYVKNIDLLSVIEDEERFTGLSDEDFIRVCLLLSLEVIFMGHDLGYIVDDVFLRMVDNLKAWNVFPWGEHIWWELYTAIRNVNSKHKDVHHKALEINPNFFVLFFVWICLVFQGIDLGVFIYSSKEVSLQTWVKDLEGLCNSLIINVITPKTKAKNMKHKVDTAGTKDKVEYCSGWRHCKFPWCNYVVVDRPFWDSLVRLDDNRLGWLHEEFLSSSGWRHCKFPWCNYVVVDRPFWDSLVRLDDNRLGWLHEEVWYGTCGILDNLVKIGQWRLVCLLSKELIPPATVLSLGMHKTSPSRVRLAHGIPLNVEDPIQTVLEYREKMINFFFDHKITFPSYFLYEVRILILTTTTSGEPSRKLKPGTQDRGCGYFMWKDDLVRRLSFSLGPSTTPSSSMGPSTRLSYSPLRSTLNLGKAECSNCNLLAEKIKALETKIKILEGTLEMERRPENHTLELAAILHELYNDIRKLDID
nr:phospholipase-like, aminotransferase-like mobile domain protein [Tanacetum cinerariifolium]